MGELKQDIAEWLAHTRARTLALFAPLREAELEQPRDGCLGPMLWDLGHIAAFEELWIVHKAGGRPLEQPERLDMYDPFEVPRPEREEQPLPGRDGTLAYMERTRRRTLEVLEEADLEADGSLLRGGFVFRMAVQHEWQHQEIVLQGLDLRCDDEPYAPATPRADSPRDEPGQVDDTARDLVPAGTFVVGSDDPTCTYDNERPAHEVTLPAFGIDRYPVTCRRWLEFMEEGGYERPELWSPAGRAWLEEVSPWAPQGWWRERNGRWWVSRFGHPRPLDPREPVQHVCAHEADAFARWSGGRLPSELEWERAAAPADGDRESAHPWGNAPASPDRANLFGDRWGPAPVGSRPAGRSGVGSEQLLGDVYEWTSSPFRGYPGFRAFPYREYSEVFFGGDYRVLRGSCWTSGPWMSRRTYRNWDFPVRRQIFAGLRLAWDVD